MTDGMTDEYRLTAGLVTVFLPFSLLVLFIVLAAGCGSSPTTSQAEGFTSPPGSEYSMITKSSAFDGLVRRIQAGTEPPPASRSMTSTEATAANGVGVKVPKDTLGGALIAINVGTSAAGNPTTYLNYKSGFGIDEEKWPSTPDFPAEIADQEETAQTSTVIGGTPRLITVAGHQGIAWAAYTFTGLDGKSYNMPPQLCWWDNGVRYFMSCWKLGPTEAQLIAVAESMYR